MGMIPSPQLGFLREVFLANHLASIETEPKQPKDRTHTNEN